MYIFVQVGDANMDKDDEEDTDDDTDNRSTQSTGMESNGQVNPKRKKT